MTLLVGDLLTDAAAVNPDGTAATLDDREVSYRQLERWAAGHAAALARLGPPRGSRVVWWSGPDLRSPAGFAAVARRGLVFAPLNPALSAEEAAPVVDYLQPGLIVAGAEQLERARAVAGGATVVSIDELHAAAPADPADAVGPGGTASPGGAGRVEDLDDREAHIVYLTSGTTGRPKGVVVSHRASWLRSFPGGSTFAAGLRGDGGILVSFPLFHYGGWHYVLEAWHHRCAFHMCRRFDGPTLVATAARHRPAAMYCIPAVWNRVLDAAPDGRGLESVRHADTGTSAAPPELIARIRRAMPAATTSILYGSSEGGHHTTLHHHEVDDRPGSVGRVAPPGVISLAADGEILYRGPTVMDGYLDRPEETAAALAGGWYHTGDLGSVDPDGYLYITGRAREVIRTGGETVAPAEVEQALAGLPGAADLAIVGLPDEQWGEVVCAVVVPYGDGPAPGVAEVRAHLADRLAAFKHPRRVVVAGHIPRTPATGQVQRTLLRNSLEDSPGRS